MMALLTATQGADDSARNLYTIARAALGDLQKEILQGIHKNVDTITVMKLLLVIMGAIWMFHIFEAISRGAKKGNVGFVMVDVWNVFYDKGPRFVWYLGLSLALLGVTAGGRAWQERAKENTVILSIGNDSEYDETGDGGSFEWMSRTFRDLLGTEDGQPPAPLRSLDEASKTANAAINGLDYTLMSREVQNRLDEARKQVTDRTVGAGDAAAAFTATGLSLGSPIVGIVMAVWDEIAKIVLNIMFITAQFQVAKALVIQYIYLSFAWSIALHFLPVAALLAYFRSLQGFLVNLAKHLIAMTVAASIIGILAQELYKSTFWLGDQGLIAMAFKGAGYTEDIKWAPTVFPYLAQKYGWAVASAQIIFLLGAISMVLSEVYGIVRGVMDGTMRTTWHGQKGGISAVVKGDS